MRLLALALIVIALIAGGAIALTGCDGDSSAEPSEVSEADVLAVLDVTRPQGGGDWLTADGDCRVNIVLIGEPQVQLYEDAGSVVATNDEGTIGVEVGPPNDPTVSEADCVGHIAPRLNEVEAD